METLVFKKEDDKIDDLLQRIVSTLEDNKAFDIVVIDIREKSNLAQFMIVASGRSDRQIKSIAEHVTEKLKNSGVSHCVEGMNGKEWVLVDAYDVIVHLFKEEVRLNFDLESLWK